MARAPFRLRHRSPDGHEGISVPRSKMQGEQQLIDAVGQNLLRSVLPSHWILREYRPDFGLDFALELFEARDADIDGPAGMQTLGEHIFIQLKSVRSPNPRMVSVPERGNVQKNVAAVDSGVVGSMLTYRHALDMEELVTVERMGIGAPVLLVIADLQEQRCSFVCLNDYIDRVLVPAHSDYRSAKSRTVHVPVDNDLTSTRGQRAVRWYGKRAKLLAAFQRFNYQYVELRYAQGHGDLLPLARAFASKAVAYDFWDDRELPVPVGEAAAALRRFAATGYIAEPQDASTGSDPAFDTLLREQSILDLWRRLELLGRTFEDVWQEWYLPTGIGSLLS